MSGEGFLDERLECRLKILGILESLVELTELLGDHSVEHVVGAGNVQRGTKSAELKLVARESERRCAVTVGIILLEVSQHVNSGVHTLLAVALVVVAVDN